MSLRNDRQTSLDFFIEKMVDLMIGLTFYENQRQDLQDAYKQAKEKHKEDCINFSIEWENRRDDEDIKSKEDLYDLIFKK